jgi:hypothetical protein
MDIDKAFAKETDIFRSTSSRGASTPAKTPSVKESSSEEEDSEEGDDSGDDEVSGIQALVEVQMKKEKERKEAEDKVAGKRPMMSVSTT